MKTPRKLQIGASLMEVLVAMSISLVVTAAMIALMSNSLASTSRIVQMTKLGDDMRVTLQMMSRDVRRANYNGDSMFCYANLNCAALAAPLDFTATTDCLTYVLDRDADGASAGDSGGGFRRVGADVGVLEMWVSDDQPAPDDCADGAGGAWVQITDPEKIDIFDFAVDEGLTYSKVVAETATDTIEQQVRKVRLSIGGRLVWDPAIERRIGDVISVRNNDVVVTPVVAGT